MFCAWKGCGRVAKGICVPGVWESQQLCIRLIDMKFFAPFSGENISRERVSGIDNFPSNFREHEVSSWLSSSISLVTFSAIFPATRCFEFLVEKAVKNIQEYNFALTPGLIIRRNRIFASSVFRFSDFPSSSSLPDAIVSADRSLVLKFKGVNFKHSASFLVLHSLLSIV